MCRDLVPLGQVKSTFNYNLDDKRVLNFENVVNDDDNIKQVPPLTLLLFSISCINSIFDHA